MSVQILDEMSAQEKFPERLSLHLEFENGIANINRISIDTCIEHLFRNWIEHRFTDHNVDNREEDSDAADFRRAVGLALNSVDWRPGMSNRLIIMPSLVLLNVESGSYREIFISAVIVGAVSVPFIVAANVLTDLVKPYEAQIVQVSKTAIIKSRSTLLQFVGYLKTLQSQVSSEEAYLDTETVYELYRLYKAISNVMGGKLSITVTTSDGQSITFEVTAKEAANQLPKLEKRLLHNPKRP
jgi:hypothetical protein